jgi:hypothetical protein
MARILRVKRAWALALEPKGCLLGMTALIWQRRLCRHAEGDRPAAKLKCRGVLRLERSVDDGGELFCLSGLGGYFNGSCKPSWSPLWHPPASPRLLLKWVRTSIMVPMTKGFVRPRKRGNPNWGKPMQAAPSVPTEFEDQIERLGLNEQTCAESTTLRRWCERNKDRCFIPEWLLKEWSIPVDPN